MPIRRPRHPGAVVVVFQGGCPQGTRTPRLWHPASVRAVLLTHALRRRLRPDGIRVVRARYGAVGWNDGARIDEGRAALDRVRHRFPGVPVGIVGHSMGARVALHLLSEPGVAAAATVAAWIPAADLPDVTPTPGLPVRVLHGRHDRVTPPQGSTGVASHLAQHGARVSLDADVPDGHAMLRHPRRWSRDVACHFATTLVRAAPVRP